MRSILHSPTPSDPRVKALIDLGMPFVLHGRTELDLPYPWLDIDNSGAIDRATSHLLDLGHRHIALINGPPHMTFAIHRERGYRDALADRGIAFDPRLIASGRFTDEIGFRAAQSMLERTPRPTAFLAGSMMTALGVFRAIRAAGLELGRDVSMIAHDDVFPYLNADNMVPSMSTTRSSIRAAGSRVADLLLQMLAGKPATDVHELWPVELVLRNRAARPAPDQPHESVRPATPADGCRSRSRTCAPGAVDPATPTSSPSPLEARKPIASGAMPQPLSRPSDRDRAPLPRVDGQDRVALGRRHRDEASRRATRRPSRHSCARVPASPAAARSGGCRRRSVA